MATYPRKDFTEFFQGANPLAVDVLDKMLTIDPDKRITAAKALVHPYFAAYADPDDEVGVACSRGMVCLLGGCGLFHLLQPESESYDDAFEGLDLTAEDWRSESNALRLQVLQVEAALFTIIIGRCSCLYNYM